MIPFETFAIIVLAALIGAGSVALVLVLRKGRTSSLAAQRELDAGRYREVLAAAGGERGERDAVLAAAIAAKHLLDLDAARRSLELLVADDPDDGEAWLELGLVAAYDGRLEEAAEAFDRVTGSRSDLLESLTLHRAWLASLAGDRRGAERLFHEVEIPLETKLRTDLGEGDPAFSEWFLHAGLLWRLRGDEGRAAWALEAARRAAPESLLIDVSSH